jgi:hypothetical protein
VGLDIVARWSYAAVMLEFGAEGLAVPLVG